MELESVILSDKTEKPKTIDEYKNWLKEFHSVEITDSIKNYYESVANKVKLDFEASPFWRKLISETKIYESEYQLQTGYFLWSPEGAEAELSVKPFNSFLSKTFRKNIVNNEKFPDAPSGGWILPSNWYLRINDIVRTMFVVKYLDGVEFLKRKIELTCSSEKNISCKVSLEAKSEGYYAVHFTILKEFEVPKVDWDTEKIYIPIEIQITTQIQEVIRKLLHKYYDEKRESVDEEKTAWQWDYKSDEFSVNYLGHILHYMEGMIMDVREKTK